MNIYIVLYRYFINHYKQSNIKYAEIIFVNKASHLLFQPNSTNGLDLDPKWISSFQTAYFLLKGCYSDCP